MIVNNEAFLEVRNSGIPQMNPYGLEYYQWWKEQKRRCIEGYWAGGKWMPGVLYFYVNFWYIELSEEGSTNKTLGKPLLRDIEWEFFPEFEKARGHSGFTEKDGIMIPEYKNEASGIMLMAGRGPGKSNIFAVIAAHGYTFFKNNEILVTGFETKYTNPTMSKIKMGLNHLPGRITMGTGKKPIVFPPPFSHRRWKDDWSKEIRNGFKYKSDPDTIHGYESRILPIVFKESHTAANGHRCSVQGFEEIGMHDNLMDSYNSSSENWMDGARQFGTPFLLGCVCAGTKVWNGSGKLVNIEDLKQEDGIIGYDGNGSYKEDIVWMKPPAKKLCYRIETAGGNHIECSEDHPLMWSKNKWNNFGVKNVTFTETSKIKVGDQLIMVNEVPVFGNKDISYARELGMMIGDGSYGIKAQPNISAGDHEVADYIKSKYSVSISKVFKQKNGRIHQALGVRGLKDLLINHGMYGQVKDAKRLPGDMDEFNEKSVCELIGGYFDTDGNVNYSKAKNTVRAVLTSVVPELLEQVKYQLIKLGIHSSIFKENRNDGHKISAGQKDYVYRLYVSKKDDVLRFKEKITLLVRHKQGNLDKIDDISKRSRYKIKRARFKLNPDNGKGKFFVGKDNLQGLRYETVTKVKCIGEQLIYNLHTGHSNTYISNGYITKQTGGDMDRGTIAAEKMFYDPDTYNIRSYVNVYEKSSERIAYFIPGWKGLNQFKDDQGNTDELASKEYLQKRRVRKKAGNDQAAYFLELQYQPFIPREAFLRKTGNLFPTDLLEDQLRYLMSTKVAEHLGQKGRLEWNLDAGLDWTPDEDVQALDFPAEGNLDGCIVIFEHPREDAPAGLYIGGTDPYQQETSEYSESVGSTFIYKRYWNPGEVYDLVVAEYTGRPQSHDDHDEQVRKLLTYYNAKGLYENQITGLKQYMDRKNCLHLLKEQPDILNDIAPGTKVNRGYGMHMTKRFKEYGEVMIRKWLLEESEPGRQNVRKLYSIPLIKELIRYTNNGNFDRCIAFMMCLYHDLEVHKQIVVAAETQVDDEFLTMGYRKLGNSISWG